MKKLLSMILVSAAVWAVTLAARAQLVGFGGPITVLGTTNSAPVSTNQVGLTVKGLQFALSGMTNNLGVFQGNILLSNNRTNATNALTIGTFSYTGSNSFTTNFVSYYTNPPLYIILQAVTSTNTVQVQAIYGP